MSEDITQRELFSRLNTSLDSLHKAEVTIYEAMRELQKHVCDPNAHSNILSGNSGYHDNSESANDEVDFGEFEELILFNFLMRERKEVTELDEISTFNFLMRKRNI